MAATNLYVRATGSTNNGGSSTGASPDRTGTDGVTNGTTTFVAATGSFSSGDVDKLINIVTKGRYRITAFTNSTTVTLSGSPTAGSGLTWNLGGACAKIADLLAAAAGTIVNGDAIWIGAGTYRENNVTCTNTNTAEVTVNGDVDGAKTGDAGMVQWTGYTTNDKTLPTTNAILVLNGKDFLTFKNILFVFGDSGGSVGIDASTTTSTNITFTDCAFLQSFKGLKIALNITVAFATALDWTIDRCVFCCATSNVSSTSHIKVNCTTGSGADYDVNLTIKNTLFLGGGNSSLFVTNVGTAAQKGNGVKVYNCSFLFCGCMTTTATQVSTTIPSIVDNSFIYTGNSTALVAGTSGQITEDYNLICAVTARTNVTAGTHSIADGSYSTLFHFGQDRIWQSLGGGAPGPGARRHFAEPMASSPLLGFGNDGNQTAYDLRNKLRPAGGSSASPAAGAMDRGNTFVTDPSPIGGGGTAIKCTGPAYAEFLVPVRATATTISCVVQWDATYTGTKPQLQIDANGQIGVAAETVTATGGSGSNETLTLSAFTPTSAGKMVTVRVISNDTNGGGLLQVDDFSVSG